VKGGGLNNDKTWNMLMIGGLILLIGFYLYKRLNKKNNIISSESNSNDIEYYEKDKYNPEHPDYATKKYNIWGQKVKIKNF
jgi:hypothetical protein